MRILQRLFLSRFLVMAIFCFSISAPQYVLSKSRFPTKGHGEWQKKNTLNKTEATANKPKGKQKKAEKLDPKGILKNKAGLEAVDKPLHQELTFPTFDQSLIRHPEKQNQFDKTYKIRTNLQKVIEFRQAKKSFESLYNKSQIYLTHDKSAPARIPKIVHQIWLGSEVPKKFSSWMSSWANMQGWEYKLWTDKDVVNFPLHNRDLYDNAKDYGEKADILRYEILYREGGLYTDVDFENINTELFDLLNCSFDFYAGLEPMEHRQPINSLLVGNAIFASIPGHPLLERVIVDMNVHYNQHGTEWAVVATGPVYFTQKFHEYNQLPDANYRNIILPPTFLFPLTYSEVRDNLKDNLTKFIKLETGAIHYWSGSWIEEEDQKQPRPKPKSNSKKKIPDRRRNWFL